MNNRHNGDLSVLYGSIFDWIMNLRYKLVDKYDKEGNSEQRRTIDD